MMKQLPSFADAHKAIRGRKDPRAFLHLGILYAQGIGTTQDEMLAQYFIRKALDMGCKEAEEYLDLGYESGSKDFGDEINTIIGDPNEISRELTAKLKVRIEKERIAGNIGNLARIRQNLLLFYPEYNREKAISDILNNRQTVDADILFCVIEFVTTSFNRCVIVWMLVNFALVNSYLYDAVVKNCDTAQTS